MRHFAALLILVASSCVDAVDFGTDLQVHGFASQGFVKTSDNSFFGDSESGSFDFTELGVNASYKATPSVLLSGQLLSRNAGDMYNGSLTVDYALVDWNLSNSHERSYGVLVGRIKNTLGLYNDTRDVAFTRPSIFLPQQVYFDSVRNLFLSADGMHLYGRFYSDLGQLAMNVGVGTNPVDDNVEISYLGTDFGGRLDSQGAAFIARAEYETLDGRWRLGLSAAKASLAFDAAPTDPIGSGDIDFVYWVASAQYNAERWSLTAEYMQEPVEFQAFGPLVDGRDSTVLGYYLQASYLVRSDVELIARYAEGYADKDDRDGTRQSAMTGGLVPPYAFYRKDWMLGLRWDVTPNFMLRAEYQWNDGTWTLSRRENPDPAATVKDWDMFSLLASYRF
ncbi:MAG: hypothetical protein LJE59_14235 [Chromatiaceae bacterium]|jgi:hypothetical protein|nr:hypothetical protein [Chromatiaceae bacterium]